MRCVFFSIVPQWDGVYFYVRMTSDKPVDTVLYVLEEFPTLLLITLYSQQLLVWARSYHIATNTSATYQGPVLYSIWFLNGFAYTMQILIWSLYDRTSSTKAQILTIDSDAWSLISSALHAFEFFVIAICLCAYGLGVHRTINAAPVSLQMRSKNMRSIVLVTSVCTAAFLIRSGALISASFAAWTNADGFDNKLTIGDVISSALFFILTEFVPVAIILYNNSKVAGSNRRSGTPSGGGAGGKNGRGMAGASKRGTSSPAALGSFRGSLYKTAEGDEGERQALNVGRSQLSPTFMSYWKGKVGVTEESTQQSKGLLSNNETEGFQASSEAVRVL